MKVFYGLKNYRPQKPIALTIGSFDGVHHGHREIIGRLKVDAARLGCLSAIMTFTPHPRIVLNKDKENLRLLNTDSEKEVLMDNLGVDLMFFMPFDQDFLSQTAHTFLQDMLLKQMGMRHIVLGYDHRFGNNREGDVHFLQANARTFGFSVDEIPRQKVDDLAVSSTKIRHALDSGEIELANKMLGYQYMLSGTVVKGDQIGRTLGFPTANLQLADKYKQLPANGVYACQAHLKGAWLNAMCYIGNRPTINGQKTNVEVNLLDWSGDLYASELQIRFVEQLRGDMKFDNLAALKQQIQADELETRRRFA